MPRTWGPMSLTEAARLHHKPVMVMKYELDLARQILPPKELVLTFGKHACFGKCNCLAKEHGSLSVGFKQISLSMKHTLRLVSSAAQAEALDRSQSATTIKS